LPPFRRRHFAFERFSALIFSSPRRHFLFDHDISSFSPLIAAIAAIILSPLLSLAPPAPHASAAPPSFDSRRRHQHAAEPRTNDAAMPPLT
jgi:hypothetical protein